MLTNHSKTDFTIIKLKHQIFDFQVIDYILLSLADPFTIMTFWKILVGFILMEYFIAENFIIFL